MWFGIASLENHVAMCNMLMHFVELPLLRIGEVLCCTLQLSCSCTLQEQKKHGRDVCFRVASLEDRRGAHVALCNSHAHALCKSKRDVGYEHLWLSLCAPDHGEKY